MISATLGLDALGLLPGGTFEIWWSQECGNELAMLTGSVAPVPEPGTMLLLGTGLIGAVAVYRKRRRNA